MHFILHYNPTDPLESMETHTVTSIILFIWNTFSNYIYLIYLVVEKISGTGKKKKSHAFWT